MAFSEKYVYFRYFSFQYSRVFSSGCVFYSWCFSWYHPPLSQLQPSLIVCKYSILEAVPYLKIQKSVAPRQIYNLLDLFVRIGLVIWLLGILITWSEEEGSSFSSAHWFACWRRKWGKKMTFLGERHLFSVPFLPVLFIFTAPTTLQFDLCHF